MSAEHFNARLKDMPSKVGRPYCTYLHSTISDESAFREVEKVKNLVGTTTSWVQKFEESDMKKFDVPVFDHMIENLVKLNRALVQPGSSVI
jgi:hypothetical protein